MDNITFKDLGYNNYHSYNFVKVAKDELLFRSKMVTYDQKYKRFVDENFEDFAKIYYEALKLDNVKSTSRKRKLSIFIKSIFHQQDLHVSLIMVKAISYLLDNKFSETEIIEKIIKEILPGAGYCKSINEFGKYIWEIDDGKKFNKSIGKAFVLAYITNNFNKDDTWSYIKKHCFLKSGVWHYKADKNRNLIEKTFLKYFNNGGIEVADKPEERNFLAFIPFGKIYDEDGNDWDSLDKEAKGSSHPIISGIASTTEVDREDERTTKKFISKMKKTAKGLPILDNTHYASAADDVIGVIIGTSGDASTFKIKVRLMKPEDSKSVGFILKQIETGIVYGFSIGGRVTKVFREFSEDKGKEIYVLDDGELFHVALTTQPANADTLGVALGKSLLANKAIVKDGSDNVVYKHSSKLAKTEPEISQINRTSLPGIAYPISLDRDTVYKNYPHHFVNEKGDLFLHEQLTLESYAKALEDKAPESVLNHFVTHLQCIGLDKKVREFKNIAENIDTVGEVKQITENIAKELEMFSITVDTVKALHNTTDDKLKIMNKIVEDVSTKLYVILKQFVKNED